MEGEAPAEPGIACSKAPPIPVLTLQGVGLVVNTLLHGKKGWG